MTEIDRIERELEQLGELRRSLKERADEQLEKLHMVADEAFSLGMDYMEVHENTKITKVAAWQWEKEFKARGISLPAMRSLREVTDELISVGALWRELDDQFEKATASLKQAVVEAAHHDLPKKKVARLAQINRGTQRVWVEGGDWNPARGRKAPAGGQ
ncbi:hypothetical protein [Amycolatopsis thermophila]|uniref:Phosphomevalonate kinase n=1 Tax=Amycolatopsis thermophila TaxID=206084 RepID=A0ABU0EN75_9PSEU|nr:hypothetical protein [Amycolatopsis thermophila]MDQ0376476.1 phosphomevalonate kinase [Amycolatopsis thermophila]